MTASIMRQRLSTWFFDPHTIELDLTIEEIMADLDPGWLIWRDRSTEERANDSEAA